MTLTHMQMLALWRRALGWEQPLADGSAETFEGYDVTDIMAADMRRWYLNMLDEGSTWHVEVADVARSVRMEPEGEGVWRVDLSPDVRRVLTVTVAGSAPIAVLRGEEASVWQPPYSRSVLPAGTVALQPAWARRNTLYLLSAARPVITRLMVVEDPGDDAYRLDESALALLPDAVKRFSTLS